MTALEHLAAIVRATPLPRGDIARALIVSGPRLSAWMARADGKTLPPRSNGLQDPSWEVVARAFGLLQSELGKADVVVATARDWLDEYQRCGVCWALPDDCVHSTARNTRAPT